MGARDRTEEVLRRIHVYLAKAEPYPNSSRRIVVDRNEFLGIVKDLSSCVEDMMEEYELTQDSKDRADREIRKKSEEARDDAKRDAEDIYAASIMYTDQALRDIQHSIDDATRRLAELYDSTRYELQRQKTAAQNNQLELMSHLEDLKDTDKYLRLIQDENIRIKKEREKQQRELGEIKVTQDAPDQPEIQVNTEYLKKMGYHIPGEDDEDL